MMKGEDAGVQEIVTIRFTEEEFNKVRCATENTNITIPNLLRCLWSEESKKLMESGNICMEFKVNDVMDKNAYKSYALRLPRNEIESNQKLFSSVPMTPSYLIKYFVLPRIEKINKKGRWC